MEHAGEHMWRCAAVGSGGWRWVAVGSSGWLAVRRRVARGGLTQQTARADERAGEAWLTRDLALWAVWQRLAQVHVVYVSSSLPCS